MVCTSFPQRCTPTHTTRWKERGIYSNPLPKSFDEISNTGVGRQILPRPYFEVLVVAADMPALWDGLTTRIRELRRLTDDFIYQPVIVESYEDALVAVILNPNIQAVVVYDGFPFRSRRNLPDLRGFLGKRPLTLYWGRRRARSAALRHGQGSQT